MERLKNMGLKKSFFLLSAACVFLSLLLVLLVFSVCGRVRENCPTGGITYTIDGTVTVLEQPTPEQQKILELLSGLELVSCIVLPLLGLGTAGALFYRIKLKEPITVLMESTEHIRVHDLDFSIPAVSTDELGQVCTAFETMRLELLKTNRELWRQAEERKRLNAAFAHDLRNPVTVLKGNIKLLRQEPTDGQVLERLESYTRRIEQYVEAMSSIQRLEQMPVRMSSVSSGILRTELEETARLLAPALKTGVFVPDMGVLQIDHGIFLTVAENLTGNAARFAGGKIELVLALSEKKLSLTVTDDGPGFPDKLLADGPKPFGRMEAGGGHFGMGLYSTRLLCVKHGGDLWLGNSPEGGAVATASFRTG